MSLRIFSIILFTLAPLFILTNLQASETRIDSYQNSSSHEYTIVERNNKKGLINEKGEMVIPARFDDLGWTSGGLTVFNDIIGYKENQLWGLMDLKANRITRPVFTALHPFQNNYIIGATRDKNTKANKFGIINTKGKVILSFKYFNLSPLHDKLLASIIKNNEVLYGLIDEKDHILIPIEHRKIKAVSESFISVTNLQNLTAIYNLNAQPLSDYVFEKIDAFDQGYAVASINSKQGLLDPQGKLILQPLYKTIQVEDYKTANILSFPLWKVIDCQNNLRHQFNYDHIKPVAKNLYKVKAGNKEGLIDGKDKTILPLDDWEIKDFKHGNALLKKGNKFGIVDQSGKVILPPIFENIVFDKQMIIADHYRFGSKKTSIFTAKGDTISYGHYEEARFGQEGFIPVKQYNHWGFITDQGKEAIACKFDEVENFSNNRAKVHYLGGCGVINQSASWIINPYKEEIKDVNGQVYLYKDKNTCGLINEENIEIYQTDNTLNCINEGFIEETQTGKFGLIAPSGRMILYPEYDTVSFLQDENFYFFAKDGKYGMVNKHGKTILHLTSSKIQKLKNIHEDFMAAQIDGKWGFIDSNSKLRIANQYDQVEFFNEEVAAVKLLNKWGFVDKQERWVVQPNFDQVSAFHNGVAKVYQGKKCGMVDKYGNLAIPLEYDSLVVTQFDRIMGFKEGKVGLYDKHGHLLIYPKYDSMKDLGNGYLLIERNGKFGVLTLEGVSTIPLIYDNLEYDPFNNCFITSSLSDWNSIPLTK